MAQPDNQNTIRSLVRQLFAFAQEWRTTHAQGRFVEADAAVQRYHAIMTELWGLEWDADLHPEEELPDELMPAYYVAYWDQYRRFQRELADIATQWRTASTQGNLTESDAAIHRYHVALSQFFAFARGDKRLLSPPEAILPDELMPAYYLAYKRSKS